MAIVTKGRTFVSGEVITPTKLNTLVDSATVTNIIPADMSAGAPVWDGPGNLSVSGNITAGGNIAAAAIAGNAISQISLIAVQRSLILG